MTDADVDAPTGAGEYRRWDGVRLAGTVLVSARPLSATRLNDAAVDIVSALGGGGFRSPDAVARETGSDPERVGRLLERLHRRGFLEWRPGRDPSYRPPVSVVVTVRDDREHLRACLDALSALDYPEYEVIVVDDGSTDGTADVASTHRLADERDARTVSVGSPDDPIGIGASRNKGVDAAAHDVVAFTDADCRPRPDWLADLVPCLAEHDLIGGRVRPAGEDAASAYEAVNSSLDMGAYASRIDPDGDTPYLATANLIGRRSAFEYVRFPERDVAEDVEVCWRALDAGFDVVYSPRGIVEHSYRSGLREFAARRSAYGASEALLARYHGRADSANVDVPLVGVAVLALGVLGAVIPGRGAAVALAGLLGVVGVAVTAGGTRLWCRYRTLPSGLAAADLVRSRARELLSSTYAVSRETTRYYAAPLALVGVSAAVGGAEGLGTAVLLCVGAAVLLPFVVEYVVHDPDGSPPEYAAYYLADHLGYQRGVYLGAIAHRTVDHVTPASRFRLTGPGAAALGRLVPDSDGSDGPATREIRIRGVTTRFRVDSTADRWWFDDATLAGERPVVADVLDRLREDDVFVDVGANVGLYSCPAGLELARGTVVAIEPHPPTADRLDANLAENGVDATVVRTALGGETGRGALRSIDADPSNGTHRLVAEGVPDGGTTSDPAPDSSSADGARAVPVRTGDELFASGTVDGQPTVVKIDVEGAERSVLSGLRSTLGDPACRLVYCEVHPDALGGSDGSGDGVRSTLREYGFTVETVQEFPDGRSIVRGRAVPGDDPPR